MTEGIEAGYDTHLNAVEADLDGSTVATQLGRHAGLSDADVAVLACADARDGVAVMDEAAGRSAAVVEGVETRGSAYVVLSAVKRGELSPEEGRDAIDAMINRGWYVAPDVNTRIIGKLESFE